jgi:hypothetical protein
MHPSATMWHFFRRLSHHEVRLLLREARYLRANHELRLFVAWRGKESASARKSSQQIATRHDDRDGDREKRATTPIGTSPVVHRSLLDVM